MSARERPDHPAELTLLDYLMDQLPPEASDSIRRHVQACRACRRTIEDLEDTVVALDNLPTVAIPHDTPVAARGALRGRRRRRPVRLAIVAAALLAVAAALAAVGVGRKIGESAGPTATVSADDQQWFTLNLPQSVTAARRRLVQILHTAAPAIQLAPKDDQRQNVILVVVDAGHRDAVARALRSNGGVSGDATRSYDVELATTPTAPASERPANRAGVSASGA